MADNRYALLIACDKYIHCNDTPYCHNDAKLLESVLAEHCGYPEDHITTILLTPDSGKNRDDIITAVSAFAESFSDAKNILFFFAGHGALASNKGDAEQKAYLVIPSTDPDQLETTGVPLKRICDILRTKTGFAFRIIDACHSGMDTRHSSNRSLNSQEFTRAITETLESGWATFAACKPEQFSYVFQEKSHGAFSYHLCETISEHDSGHLLPEAVKVMTCDKMKEWCQVYKYSQTPTLNSSISGNVSFGVKVSSSRQSKNKLQDTDWALALQPGHDLGSNQEFLDSRLRIPIWGSILVTEGILDIIDTPQFQRLRGVRQLGPTELVFPGAIHTRFEHSLGVYWLSLRFCEVLCKDAAFQSIAGDLQKACRTLMLAALLHDIGHYPYSHWIEEISSLTNLEVSNHEQRACSLLTDEGGEIAKLIKEKWEVDLDDVCYAIAGPGTRILRRDKSDGKMKLMHIPEDKRKQLFHSIISSYIDIDKLDYLVRDSSHCGVTHGYGVDVERLIESLIVDADSSIIGLTHKGRSLPMAILASRNIMYQEVYWHKTVRSCDAMFKRAFYEVALQSDNTDIDRIKDALQTHDSLFVNLLYSISTNPAVQSLLEPLLHRGRKLYKAVYLYNKGNRYESEGAREFFRRAQEIAKHSYADLCLLSDKLAVELGGDHLSTLIEIPPVKTGAEVEEIDRVRIYDKRTGWETLSSSTTNLNSFLKDNRQCYIFCDQVLARRLKNYSSEDWATAFSEAL